MGARYIHHVTLASGHVRRSPRAEVRDDVIERLTPLVEQVVAGERVGVPGQTGYTMSGVQHGQCCVVTIWRAASDTASPEGVPVLTVGIAPHSRCGAHLWRHLHEREDLPYATDPEDVPPEPWCADRLDVGAISEQGSALSWTGDLSRCLAWTWLEMRA